MRPRVANVCFSAVLLVAAFAWPFTRGPARLELVENSRTYAPDQLIQVRLVNRGDTPIYFLTEVRRRGARTAQRRRLPGLPIYERRRRRFFFRVDRWVYATHGRARFRAAALEPGDSVVFRVSFAQPSKFKVHVSYWRTQDIGDANEFLQLGLEQIKQHYRKKMRWTSTPTFRIRSPAPKASAKK